MRPAFLAITANCWSRCLHVALLVLTRSRVSWPGSPQAALIHQRLPGTVRLSSLPVQPHPPNRRAENRLRNPLPKLMVAAIFAQTLTRGIIEWLLLDTRQGIA